jgi:hypothetical protein
MMGLDLKRARGEGNNSLTDDQWSSLLIYTNIFKVVIFSSDNSASIPK